MSTVPIDIDFARAYLKADGDDDDLITSQLAAATQICQDYCNRVFYPTQEAADADFAQAITDRGAAVAARNTTLAGMTGMDSETINARRMVYARTASQLARTKARINGIVIDDAINAAILMTLGHLYINREDNVVTSGANAVQVPVGAQRILQSKLWIGDLVDSDSSCYTPLWGCYPAPCGDGS